jgi:hypothetical protein
MSERDTAGVIDARMRLGVADAGTRHGVAWSLAGNPYAIRA